MSDEFDVDENDDNAGGYDLEEYSIAPTQSELADNDKSKLDFRMDAPPPQSSSIESRLNGAYDDAPEGMQLARGPTGAAAACCRSAPTVQTGPKAVKADYEHAKKELRSIRMMEAVAYERKLQPQVKVDIDAMFKTKEEEERMKKANKGSDEDSDDDDGDNDAVFESFKQQRIAFVQNSLPRFGTHNRVTKGQFANLVKDVHPLVFVVCHLYQNSIESCIRLNFSFEALAPQFPHVCFVRMRSTEAIASYSDVGLPTLLVYKGGNLVTSAVKVTSGLSAKFTDIEVAKMLQAKSILTVPTGLSDSSSRLTQDMLSNFSDDENSIAAAENRGGTEAFNRSSSKTNEWTRKTNVRIRRAADSGSDSD